MLVSPCCDRSKCNFLVEKPMNLKCNLEIMTCIITTNTFIQRLEHFEIALGLKHNNIQHIDMGK